MSSPGPRGINRIRLVRLLRAIWRYRRQLAAHGDAYQAELATAVRTQLDAGLGGRVALAGYRVAMRLLLFAAIAVAGLAALLALLLYRVEPQLALLAIVVAIPAVVLGWWRLLWGRPLDWLDHHSDPSRTVPLEELPQRLQALAAETRTIANVPARLADELDALAATPPDPGLPR